MPAEYLVVVLIINVIYLLEGITQSHILIYVKRFKMIKSKYGRDHKFDDYESNRAHDIDEMPAKPQKNSNSDKNLTIDLIALEMKRKNICLVI